MTLFGEKLKSIIDENGINIYRLSQQAGIERTIIHKIISGNRIPDDKYVGKMIAAMPLTPYERDELHRAYNICKDGEFLYNQRIQIRELIEKMSRVRELQAGSGRAAPVSTGDAGNAPANRTEPEIFCGTLSINNLIDDMLAHELRTDNPCVRFMLPHNYNFFFDNLLLKYNKAPGLKAECIFEYYKNADILREKRNVNIDVISALTPFIMHCGDFEAYYIYSMHPASKETVPMPYYILISSGMVTLAADMQTAIYYPSPDIAACYRGIFDNMKAKGQVLIRQVASMDDLADTYSANIDKSTGLMGFGSHPCVACYHNLPLLDAHLPGILPDREHTVGVLMEINRNIRMLLEKNPSFSYFTTSGFDAFVDNGIVQTINPEFFSPYTPRERAGTIQQMIKDTKKGAIGYRVIDTSKLRIPEYFYADVFGGSHMNIVINGPDEKTGTIVVFENSIVEAFYDFLENAILTDIVYTKEDTLKVLNNALERVRALC